jgi:ribonuclease P protein component
MATAPTSGPPAEGQPGCRLAPLRGRAELDALRRRGRRARTGALGVTFLSPADPGPRVARTAFAVDRRAGTAVVRNRIRRRLRAGLRQLAGAGALRPGAYLVRAQGEVAIQPWPQLLADLEDAVRRATHAGSAPAARPSR